LNDLDEKSVYLHFDWAMKYIPQHFREKQEDFFGKRGICWHISCAVYRENGSTKNISFAHLFESSTSQDVNAVIGIIDSVFRELLEQKGSMTLYLRSDNAGCYHNQTLIVAVAFLAQKYTHNLARYDFYEAQTGKDICDRKISPIKRAINTYLESGHDVLTASGLNNYLF
jgi:hypothetical protein